MFTNVRTGGPKFARNGGPNPSTSSGQASPTSQTLSLYQTVEQPARAVMTLPLDPNLLTHLVCCRTAFFEPEGTVAVSMQAAHLSGDRCTCHRNPGIVAPVTVILHRNPVLSP